MQTGLVVEGLQLLLGFGLVLTVVRSRDVPEAEAGFELKTGWGRRQRQVTWGCRLQ